MDAFPRWLCIVAAGVLAASACARATVVAGTGDRNLITSAEIRDANVGSAYDVIAKLRTHYLRSRGPNSIMLKQEAYATVFLDDTEYGAISTLRSIAASSVSEIRFLEGSAATTKFGSKYVGGIIQIFTLPR